jgi:hypothetical protein
LTVIDNTADDNFAGGNGLPSVTSRLTIDGAGPTETIIQTNAGRILHIAASGTLNLRRLTIRGGRGGFFEGGGAIFNRGTLALSQSVIRESDSGLGDGGAILNLGTLTIVDSSIVDNLSHSSTIASEGRLHIARSTIANNDGGVLCGGIRASFGPTTIEDSTISANFAEALGGGLCVGGTATIINTTIANNISGLDPAAGAGLFVFASSTIRLINVTIADNLRDASPVLGGGGGGIFVDENALVQLQNSIVARNLSFGGSSSPDLGPDCFGFGFIVSLGTNIIGDTADCPIDLVASDHVGDPGLGEFVDDDTQGGGHIPLLPGSPAIDAGSRQACPRRDQLQNRRVDGDGDHRRICDIGAIEFVSEIDTE